MTLINRKFILCAWNEHNSVKWKEDSLADAFSRMLLSMGWEQVKLKGTGGFKYLKTVELVVLVPRMRDIREGAFTAEDMWIFRRLLPGHEKRVVLLDRSRRSSFSISLEWAFHFHIDSNHNHLSEAYFNKFKEWLLKTSNTPSNNEVFDYSKWPTGIGQLLQRNGNKTQGKTWLPKTDVALAGLSKSGRNLIKCKNPAKLFFGLIRISCCYNRLEHDMNRDISNAFEASDKNLSNVIRKKQALECCVDLKRALHMAAVSKSVMKTIKSILVIDDHYPKIEPELKTISSMFFPGCQIDYWDTNRGPGKNELSIEELVNYSSFHDLETIKGKTINNKSIEDHLKKTSCILVDILLPDTDNKEQPLGIKVIRGLQWLQRDLNTAEAGPKKESVNIIAISRADDLDKIQAAIRAGAIGYVLKNRLSSLPAVLGAISVSAQKSVSDLRRNFRLLYNLPNETVRLLKAASIPSNDTRKPIIKPSLSLKNWCDLLRSIPKTDLHVHAGSCMSSEFLVIASLVLLLRHSYDSKECNAIKEDIPKLCDFWNGKIGFSFHDSLQVDNVSPPFRFCFANEKKSFSDNKEALKIIVKQVKCFLQKQIEFWDANQENAEAQESYNHFRSVLHKSLSLPDHWNKNRLLNGLEEKADVELFLFGIMHTTDINICDKDDVLRIFLMYLSSQHGSWIPEQIDVLDWFKSKIEIEENKWNLLREIFYIDKSWSFEGFKNRNWELESDKMTSFSNVDLKSNLCYDFLNYEPTYEAEPIGYLLSTGSRAHNLKSYLEGCDFSGAEHLRHPYLIHLYAQQTVHRFIQQGVLYAELRASITGYENPKFNFSVQDACNCIIKAFETAQNIMLKKYHSPTISTKEPLFWLWKKPFGLANLFASHELKWNKSFPVKVSIILTGKRHKATRQMLKEAAAATVLHTLPVTRIKSAAEFVRDDMPKCRLVGFDLAGEEDGHHPQQFQEEYAQLAKLHIPITAHAGENAPSDFVESAVLDLRAKRLGHGLSLVDDKLLLHRVREDGICVELCPVSNFQTNQFIPAGKKPFLPEREYPLRELLKNGNAICINTDNPSVSNTNIVKECFHASYAYGGDGLSLWELLRILRMGFSHSFLSLPERRAIIELANQIIFDLFSQEDVVAMLRSLLPT